MKREEALEVVKKVLIQEGLILKTDDVRPEQELFSDLGVDSIDLIELAMAFEEEFMIDVDDETLEAWNTVEDVLQWVESTVVRSPVSEVKDG